MTATGGPPYPTRSCAEFPPSTAQSRPWEDDLSSLGMTEFGLEARRLLSSTLPPFAKSAKDGAPLVSSAACGVQGSSFGVLGFDKGSAASG
jgi:hypothetical protein